MASGYAMTTQFYSAFSPSLRSLREAEKTLLIKIIQIIQINNSHSIARSQSITYSYSYFSVFAGLVMAAL